MVFVKTARAVVDTVDRLRSGWLFGGRQPIRGSFRLHTWQQPRYSLTMDSHRIHLHLLLFRGSDVLHHIHQPCAFQEGLRQNHDVFLLML